MTANDFREIALALDGVTEKSHMNHPDFRANGRIFASLLSNEERAGLKLSPVEQRELMRRHPTVFTPASGAWGRQGWTIVDLASASTNVVRGAVQLAYGAASAKVGPRRSGRTRAGNSRSLRR